MLDLLAAARDGADGLVLLDGLHAVKHAIRFGATVRGVASPDPGAALRLAATLAPDVADRLATLLVAVGPGQLGARVGRLHPTGVVGVAERPARPDPDPALAEHRTGPALLAEDVRHEGNLGALVRVAAAADASALFVLGGCDPWRRGAVRGAAGLQWALPVVRVADTTRLTGTFVALDPDGDPAPEPLPRDAVLCVGSERHGLSPALRERCTRRLALPMRRGVSSMNLATAAAAALYRHAAP